MRHLSSSLAAAAAAADRLSSFHIGASLLQAPHQEVWKATKFTPSVPIEGGGGESSSETPEDEEEEDEDE